MALSYHFRELGPDHFTTSSTVNLLKQLLIMIKLWSLAVPFRTKVSSTKGSVDCSVVVFFIIFFFLACCFLFFALGHLFVFVVGEWRRWGISSSLKSWLQSLAKISVRLCSLYPWSLQYVLFCCVLYFLMKCHQIYILCATVLGSRNFILLKQCK